MKNRQTHGSVVCTISDAATQKVICNLGHNGLPVAARSCFNEIQGGILEAETISVTISIEANGIYPTVNKVPG